MSETTEKVEYFGASKFEIAMISLTQVAANLFNVCPCIFTTPIFYGFSLVDSIRIDRGHPSDANTAYHTNNPSFEQL